MMEMMSLLALAQIPISTFSHIWVLVRQYGIMFVIIVIIIIVMAYWHIPTMTDSHHGGFLSVMTMVGICQVTKSHR